MFNFISKWFLKKAISEADQAGVAMFSVEHGENVHKWIMAKLKSLSGWFSAKYGANIKTDEQLVEFFDAVMHHSGDPAFDIMVRRVDKALTLIGQLQDALAKTTYAETTGLLAMADQIEATLDGTAEVQP